jgi:hypothetical protein
LKCTRWWAWARADRKARSANYIALMLSTVIESPLTLPVTVPVGTLPQIGLRAGLSCAQHGVAIIGAAHLNKSAATDALMRVTGSLAFVAAAAVGESGETPPSLITLSGQSLYSPIQYPDCRPCRWLSPSMCVNPD